MLFGRRTRRGKGGPVVVRPGWVIYHVFFVLLIYYVLLVVFVGGDWRWMADRPWVMFYRWIAG